MAGSALEKVLFRARSPIAWPPPASLTAIPDGDVHAQELHCVSCSVGERRAWLAVVELNRKLAPADTFRTLPLDDHWAAIVEMEGPRQLRLVSAGQLMHELGALSPVISSGMCFHRKGCAVHGTNSPEMPGNFA